MQVRRIAKRVLELLVHRAHTVDQAGIVQAVERSVDGGKIECRQPGACQFQKLFGGKVPVALDFAEQPEQSGSLLRHAKIVVSKNPGVVRRLSLLL